MASHPIPRIQTTTPQTPTRMKVLIACEFSGVVREAFTKRGHDATSCDYLASEQPFGKHYQGDMFQIAYGHWDLIIAHPPCTDLAVSGSKYWAEKVKDGRQGRAIQFVERIWQLPCPRICIENPVGALSTRSKLGKPAQYIHPYQFGHPEAKKTGLWLKNLPPLIPTNELELPERGYWDNQTPSGQNKLGPSEDRWKLRAATYQGIADAMASQWG